MSRNTLKEPTLIGHLLEGFFYGLYSGIFAMYLQHHWQAHKTDTGKTKNIIFYAICTLYALFFANFFLGITALCIQMIFPNEISLLITLETINNVIMAFCYFTSHFILIYRCWIVCNCDIRVVIIPEILTFIFLGTWLSGIIPASLGTQGKASAPQWGGTMVLTGLAMSLTVHTVVTGLIVFKILKVYWQVKSTFDNFALIATGGTRKLRSIIFILIESGMVLFASQLARMVFSIFRTPATGEAFELTIGIHNILHGITPTIILVRASMGLSFHDEKSMVEVTSYLHFAPDNWRSIEETDSIDEEGRDHTDLQLSSNVDTEENILWKP